MTITATTVPPIPLPRGSIQGTLALQLLPDHTPPLVGPTPGRPGGDVVPIEQPLRLRMEQWAHRYAQAVVEIVNGDRPVSQVLRWTTPEVYANLTRRAVLVARAGGHRPGEGRRGQVTRSQVIGVRTCFVTPRKVEVSIHVRHGERSRAIAACFELIRDRWQCSALEFA